ncbi:hypothetical protein T265_01101 [Opisthorchis viverrini]|uniref:Calpain catalytic domain-containing protein n=1 Tax=Opisthorchis viverrini TaxID=6198 RepID=A0A075AB26_OPIVI|nr:hypothetical protein T265_01101 [Opisthorchis viverrini]KER33020.1 hypothetical protein T265_01101 [Opisthorchis viverrini]
MTCAPTSASYYGGEKSDVYQVGCEPSKITNACKSWTASISTPAEEAAESPKLRSPPPRTVPVRLRGNETARSYLRRLKDDRAVTRNRVHKSESLGQSRRWYVQEVASQRGEGRLFEDPFFPADDSSIRRGGKPGCSEYDWLRPHEVTRDPKFIIDGISRFDVKQGEIGDCWFLAALSSLSIHPKLLDQVVPSGQTFSMQDCNNDKTIPYCGMFWFRFWRFGEWYDVVVDDRLPTRRGRLVFMHSSDRNEFWSALLEKAYVKLLGTYEAMKGGNTAEAMEDFTGGLTELMDLGAKAPPDLFRIMERAHCRSSLMACSIDATPEQVESEGPYGLILGHAYSVTDVRTVSSKEPTKQVRLIRLRNPWGNDREWYGPWSDKSSEWNAISVSERKRIGLVFDNDGEFWISYEDFVRYFSRLEFCHLGPETGHFGQPSRLEKPRGYWEMTTEVGEWIKYSTAGGCRNNERTFHMNPQFRVHVIDPDETDDDNTGTIIIGLMQMGRRENFQEHHTIGYALYLIPENYPSGMLLPRSFFERNVSKCRSPAFINIREVCGRHKLPPGEYMIIPSTFEPNQEAKFLLRIFSEKPCNTSELDDPTTISHDEATGISTLAVDDKTMLKLEAAFNDIAGPSGDIRATELRDILNASFTKGILSADLSGALGFAEFKKLWMDLRIWKVSNKVYNAIVQRYADSAGRIMFDDYILLLVRLVTVVETFKAQERLNDGRAVFGLEDTLTQVI